jgi:hypothetical protein
MRNARGQAVTLPTTAIVEAIRRVRVTEAVGVKDKATGEPAGVAFFSCKRLRLILTPEEMQAVTDLLTLAEMEALFTNPEETP